MKIQENENHTEFSYNKQTVNPPTLSSIIEQRVIARRLRSENERSEASPSLWSTGWAVTSLSRGLAASSSPTSPGTSKGRFERLEIGARDRFLLLALFFHVSFIVVSNRSVRTRHKFFPTQREPGSSLSIPDLSFSSSRSLNLSIIFFSLRFLSINFHSLRPLHFSRASFFVFDSALSSAGGIVFVSFILRLRRHSASLISSSANVGTRHHRSLRLRTLALSIVSLSANIGTRHHLVCTQRRHHLYSTSASSQDDFILGRRDFKSEGPVGQIGVGAWDFLDLEGGPAAWKAHLFLLLGLGNQISRVLKLSDGSILGGGGGGGKKNFRPDPTRMWVGSGFKISRTFRIGSILKKTRPNYTPNTGGPVELRSHKRERSHRISQIMSMSMSMSDW
uniref:Uncharacterized protein n=1 Tax=Cucumis melo TaxID=3656 RepID=A0A9I9E870_CUCME